MWSRHWSITVVSCASGQSVTADRHTEYVFRCPLPHTPSPELPDYIFKGAQTELDVFSKAGITVFYHGKDEIYISIKDFYENVRDLEPFECGGHLWNGYTCTSFGYPYTMLEAKDDGCVFQVMILMKNGEYEISFNDADVRSIIESISTCE